MPIADWAFSPEPWNPKPANIDRPPVRPRPPLKVVPKTPPPAVDGTDFSGVPPKISFGVLTKFLGTFAGAVLTPTPAGVGSDLYEPDPKLLNPEGFATAPPELKRMAIGRIAEPIPEYELPVYKQPPVYTRPKIIEVPFREFGLETRPAFTRSPKRGDLIINVPDFMVPAPVRVDPDPKHDIWNVPDNLPIEELYPKPLVMPKPEVAPEVFPSPKSRVVERGVVIEVKAEVSAEAEASAEPRIQVRVRPTSQRASVRRRKDTKANRRMLKAAHKLINVTYGTYSEVMDFLEALAWNVYEVRNGKRVLVMGTNGGSVLETLDGLAKGRYEVDLASLIIDYAFMQAQDFVVGRMSQLATGSAIDNWGWTNPVGPSGFANAMNAL